MSFISKILGNGEGDGNQAPSYQGNITLITKVLEELNCAPSQEKEDDSCLISFNFQAGYFQIRVFKDRPSFDVMFVNIYSVPFSCINDVRQICNKMNINTNGERLVYSLNYEQNEVDLHLINSLIISKQNARFVLERALTNTFYWQRVAVSKLDEQINEAKNTGVADSERDKHEDEREQFLLQELEMESLSAVKNLRETNDSAITLGKVMTEWVEMPQIVPTSLSIFGYENHCLSDKNEILNYPISQAIIAKDGSIPAPTALLSLSFRSAEMPDEQRNIVFFLEKKADNANTIYYHLTASLVPLSPTTQRSLNDTSLKNIAFTALIAHEKRTDKQLHDEFLYFWKEAKSKQNSNNTANLTPEEEILMDVSNPTAGFYLYRGKQLFLEKRFAEAAEALANGYKILTTGYAQPTQNQLGLMNEVAYLTGVCYMELGLMQKAYFYLDTTISERMPKHIKAYVECLMALHDHRAIRYIDMFLQEIGSTRFNNDADEPLPPQLLQLQLFLFRMKTLIHIDLKQWQQARNVLEILENADVDNRDFVIKNMQIVDLELEKLKANDDMDYNRLLPPKDENTEDESSTNDKSSN